MKIINRFTNTFKPIKNKPLEYTRIKINSEDDIIQLSSKKQNICNKKPSKFAKMKEVIKSKMVHINSASVKELEEADLGDFLGKTQSIIYKGVGIPKGLFANIKPDYTNKKVAMYYDWSTNSITINFNVLDKSKSYLFSGLRHEIEHQKQAYDVFRTEGLGEDAVKYFINLQTNAAIESNPAITQKEIKEINLRFSDYYNKLQKKIIEKMGTISANSDEAKVTGEYFENLKNQDPTSFKSVLGVVEQEAYFAGFVGRIEYLIAKWFNV